MSKRTDSKPTDQERETSQLNVEIDADLHANIKAHAAKKRKPLREVVEKSLRQEVATAK